jgi:pimeloyl-ACP methyl ester carboxylesterase
MFVAAASGLDWATCRALLEERIPGVVTQSIKDADTFFGVELPALTEWEFGSDQAAAIHRPVLSVLGAETQPLWVEIADFLRAALPYVEECTIDGVGHLLQIQQPQPVARAIAQFLGGNSMTGVVRSDEARIMTTVPPSAR